MNAIRITIADVGVNADRAVFGHLADFMIPVYYRTVSCPRLALAASHYVTVISLACHLCRSDSISHRFHVPFLLK